MDSSVSAVILAGGSGTRLSANIPKQYLNIGDKPVLAYSLDVFNTLSFVGEIIVVAAEDMLDYCRNNIIELFCSKKPVKLVKGGAFRQESSFKGVIAASSPYVMVHDGARPFAAADDITRLYKTMLVNNSAILAAPVTDTIKETTQDAQIMRTIERDNLWAAATPQAFLRETLIKAHKMALDTNFVGTDDASLLEFIGEKVTIVECSSRNIKITTSEDLVFADFLVRLGEHKL
ncbi:MAG: 2-C-methyl-D-erythritol 4-phosphate cytidylyltransferase [Defluviitaleaceae bacterium]|nr:2-C-methyl-D-erythritol 4-phosphate cytidylyltransferase [Defluviitaleaceae bacterium]